MSAHPRGSAERTINVHGVNQREIKPERPARFKLRHRLLVLTAVAVLPAFVIVLGNHLASRELRSAEVDAYATNMTDTVRDEVVRGLSAAATLMLAMGRASVVQDHDVQACQTYAQGLQRDLPTILDIAIADETGTLYCHSGVSELATMQASIDRLAETDEPGLVVGNYTSTPEGATLPIGLVISDAEEVVSGYIQLHVNMAELVRLITDATSGLQDTRTIVTDRNGVVLLSLPEGFAAVGEPVEAPYADLLTENEPGSVRLVSTDGVAQLVGYRPALENIPVAAVFVLPEGPLMAPIDRAAWTNSAIALFGAALAFMLASFFGATFIQRPVNELDRTLKARRAGNQTVRTGLDGDQSEFGQIARSIDQLFDELDDREQLQRQTEEQRDLFAREVQHRVKNLLAIIHVIARQSLSRPDAAPEVLAFENRIDAIIRTNTKLLAQNNEASAVRNIVEEALAPFVGNESGRLIITGPDIRLRTKVVSALSMALHELATNAVKYGALSDVDGRITIHWAVDQSQFVLTWSEFDGPPVVPPAETGFGSVLITRVLQAETRGDVQTSFDRNGFTFRLTTALAEIQDGVDQALPPET